MIAEVYPLKRLPRNMKAFDYRVPDNMVVTRGNFVQVQLRGKKVWGIVRAVKNRPERGIRLKEVLDINNGIILREEELSFFEWLASDLIQSVSSVLYSALPTPPKRAASEQTVDPASTSSITLPRNEIQVLTRTIKILRSQRECILQISDLKRMAAVIAAYRTAQPENKLVVIVPTVKQARDLSTYLSDLKPVVVTGEETNNERYRRYQAMRQSSSAFCIGTKVLSLLVDETVTTFFVLNSSDKNHKQFDRNPRFDVRDTLWELHDRLQANIFFMDPAPRIIDQSFFPASGRLTWESGKNVQILDMRIDRQGSANFFLSHTAENAIQSCLKSGKKILCVLNRKGVSAGLRCKDCSHRVLCPGCQTPLRAMEDSLRCASCSVMHPMIFRCSNCGSNTLQHVSIGIDGFAKSLEGLFPGVSVETLSKESCIRRQTHHVLVTTNYFFEDQYNPFSRLPYGLVILIDADTALFTSSLSAKELALRQVLQWRGVADSGNASYLIQTSYPNLFSDLLSEPLQFFTNELDLRKRYNKPPFSRSLRIINKDPEQRRAELELHQLGQQLQHTFTCDVSRQMVTKVGVEITVAFKPETFSDIKDTLTDLPDHYIIDTQRNL